MMTPFFRLLLPSALRSMVLMMLSCAALDVALTASAFTIRLEPSLEQALHQHQYERNPVAIGKVDLMIDVPMTNHDRILKNIISTLSIFSPGLKLSYSPFSPQHMIPKLL